MIQRRRQLKIHFSFQFFSIQDLIAEFQDFTELIVFDKPRSEKAWKHEGLNCIIRKFLY